jgi:hypothetical protein
MSDAVLIERYGVTAVLGGNWSRWEQLAQRNCNVNWDVWYYGNYINGIHPELVGMPAYPLPLTYPPPPISRRVI